MKPSVDALTRRQRRALLLVGIFLGALVLPASVGAVAGFLSNSVLVSGPVPVVSPDGPDVTVTGGADVDLSDPFPDANTVDIRSSKGNITLSSPGRTDATIHADEISGTWTELTALNVSGATLTIETDDKQTVRISGGLDTLGFRDVASDDGTADLSYSGAGSVTITGLKASTSYYLRTADGSAVASATSDGSGEATFSLSQQTTTTDLELATANAPTVSDPSPGDGEVLQSSSTLAVTISDADFAAGDSVTVEFYVDGTSVGTDSVSANGTASVNWADATSGSHDWHVVATDSYGTSTTSPTWSFGIPSELRIYNETAPSELLSGSDATVEVRFYADNQVIERSTTTGIVSLDGLPVNQKLIVSASADGYESRRIIIDSLIEQQSIYLLPTSAESARIVFSLDDSTGRFTQAELFIEKAITQNGSTNYQVIAADSFSAAGEFAVTLENNERYRLRARNQQGETRVLGSYLTAGDAAAVLPIGQISLSVDTEQADVFKAELIEEGGQRAVRIGYRNPSETAVSVTFEVVNASDPSDVIRANATVDGPFGTLIETIPLPANAPEQVGYEVNYQIEYRDGTESGGTEAVGSMSEWFGSSWAIDDQLLSLIAWVGILAITGLVVIFNPKAAAMVAPIIATVFTWMGAIDIPLPILALAGGAALIFQIGGDR